MRTWDCLASSKKVQSLFVLIIAAAVRFLKAAVQAVSNTVEGLS